MANLLTILRMLLCVLAIEFIFSGRPDFVFSALVLTVFVIVLDGLDGVVARALNEQSKFGSVFDIIGDRVVECLYWIAFAVLGWVAVWVPMLVVTRAFITDGLRSIALSQGYTAFGSSTMMKNKFFHFLTASRFSRAVYGIAKSIVFFMLIIAHFPSLDDLNIMTVNQYLVYLKYQPVLLISSDVLVYVTVFMCIIRGIPVLIEGRKYIQNENN